MKLIMVFLSFYSIQTLADLNIGEQTYLDGVGSDSDDFNLDLDSATQTKVVNFDKNKELTPSKNNRKILNDSKLEDADVLLETQDLPKEDPKIVEKRIDEHKRKNALKEYMVNNDIYDK